MDAVVKHLHSRLVKLTAYYARRTGTDGDDLLQEAWIGLLEALPCLDVRIGSPDQYLIRHARWRLLDHVRRMRARDCLPLKDRADECRSLDDAIEEAALEDFAGQLRATQRQVLYGLLAGLTWREVGEWLGCTSANVAYHVRLIRRQYEAWSAAQT
jgi:RNA polymerase sigma factor (sigma-70 family)